MAKFFATEIHGESHPVSTCILVMYLMTRYFHMIYHANALLAKLPNTSTRGLLPVSQTIVDYYLVDHVAQRALQ